MELRLLGSIQIIHDGEVIDLRGDGARALLGMLARHPGRPVSSDALVGALWGATPPPTAASALRMQVSRLRQRLGPTSTTGVDIVSRHPGYALVVEDPDMVDHVRFQRLLREARNLHRDGNHREVVSRLDAALAIWRGPAFDGLDVEPLAVMSRHLNTWYLDAKDLLFESRLELGEGAELVADLEAAVRAHPGRERLTGHLMRALYRAGRQGDALEAYQRLRQWLGTELGLEPSKDLQDLQVMVLSHDPTLDAPTGPARDTDGGAPGLPPSLAAYRTGSFVGRGDVVADLVDVLGAGAGASGRTGLVLGGPGIGKSRLLAEAAADAGGRVLHGWAEPGATVPLGTLRSMLVPLLAEPSTVGDAAREAIAVIDERAPNATLPRAEFVTRVDALADLLATTGPPTVVVMDDLQWADSISLAVIHHLARRGLPGLRLLLAGRQDGDSDDWASFLTDLSALPGVVAIHLQGLVEGEVAELVDVHEPDLQSSERLRVAGRLRRATAGNPYLLRSLLRAGVGNTLDGMSLDAVSVPRAVARVVARGLEGVGPPTREVLQVAAVMGPTFRVDGLADVAELEPAAAHAAVMEARRVGVVEEDADDPRDLRFEHDLLRGVLREELSASQVQQIHRRMADRLADGDPITRAYHLVRAGAQVDPDELLVRLMEATDLALELTAWSEATDLARVALDRWGGSSRDTGVRVDLLVRAGHAAMGVQGRTSAMHWFEEALDLALDCGHVDRIDDILLTAGRFYTSITPGDPLLELVDQVLDQEGSPGTEALAEIIVHRALAEGSSPELRAMADRMRVHLPDPEASMPMMRAEMYLLLGTPDPAEGLATAEKALAATGASAAEPTMPWLDATVFVVGYALLRGDVRRARQALASFTLGNEQLRLVEYQWLEPTIRAGMALDDGDAEAGRRLSEEAHRYGTRHGVPDARGSHAFQMLVTALLFGGLDDVLSVMAEATASVPDAPPYLAAAALAHAGAGQHEAAGELVRAALAGLAAGPPGVMTPVTLAASAWVTVLGEDVDAARQVLPLLMPWRGTAPRAALLGGPTGPADRLLGLLLRLLGDVQAAREHLGSALAMAESMGSPVWTALCLRDLARATPPGREQEAMQRRGAGLVERLGMNPVAGRRDGAHASEHRPGSARPSMSSRDGSGDPAGDRR